MCCLRQGAERKTRDEERRAAKRKLVVTGRNKRLDELYHPSCERSEFYHMADLLKPPTLFTPVDHEKVSSPLIIFILYEPIKHFAPLLLRLAQE